MILGAPRIIKSIEHMKKLWEEYKDDCNNQIVLTHDFSAKNSEFVSKELRRSVTYTIEGFCVFVGLSRSKFYENYANSKKYGDTVTRMKEECEIDARKKFELQIIPSQLAGLWMSNHGYSTKAENDESTIELVSNVLSEVKKQSDEINKQTSRIHSESDA
ncbi:MAG: DNA-packaging protein [Oscillospiraceae bacterium]|nr:DNA-packaging protein [Oscillospiraceae bacterium]